VTDVLVLGYSNLARRRILPALAALGVTGIEVASRSAGQAEWPPPGCTRTFNDYGDALEHSAAALVYISTVNSLHAAMAEQALEAGRHVVVDKPLCLSVRSAERLASLASRRGLCLAEACVWDFHPQVQAARDVFAAVGSRPEKLSAVFSFPPLASDNFRYRANCGGGALWDLGPYAVTPGRLFFGAEPEAVVGCVLSQQGAVDTAFAVMLTYPGGCALVGQYGFTTGYANRLEVLGSGVAVSLAPAFTSRADASLEVVVQDRSERRTVTLPPSDSFALFLQRLIGDIRAGNHEPWRANLLADARALGRLREACGV
jgi:predicted dehydrogenase